LASKNNKNGNKNNKNNKNNNKNKQNPKKKNYTGFVKSRNFKWTVLGAAIIVVIVLVAILNPFFAAPSSIKADTYYKVSNGDLLSNGSSAVFFLSWIGCPIGATDSWAIYSAINSTTDIYSHVTLHSADPTDIYSNDVTGQPGLLFNGNISLTLGNAIRRS
jgi:ABC-type dipeptide/oligopeptide/nickel transport system permease subunit